MLVIVSVMVSSLAFLPARLAGVVDESQAQKLFTAVGSGNLPLARSLLIGGATPSYYPPKSQVTTLGAADGATAMVRLVLIAGPDLKLEEQALVPAPIYWIYRYRGMNLSKSDLLESLRLYLLAGGSVDVKLGPGSFLDAAAGKGASLRTVLGNWKMDDILQTLDRWEKSFKVVSHETGSLH